MKSIDPNYQPPEKTFASFEDGKYKVKGITWFTLDDKDRPILVAQKDGKLVGRFRFNLLDGQEGPPMSVTLPEMSLLAKAMGASRVPPVPDEGYAAMVTKFMIEIAQLVADKQTEVDVAKGWVSYVPGMVVPEGYYHFHISDIHGDKDEKGQPKPREGDWGPYFYVVFTVDYGEGGKETPYKGLEFSELVSYGIEVVDGEADFKRAEDGSYTSEAARLSKLMRLGAPHAFGGDFSPPNPHNLLPFIRDKFLEAHQMLKGSRAVSERKNKGKVVRKLGLSWATLEMSDLAQSEPKRLIESMNPDDKARDILVEALKTLAEGKEVTILGTYNFTDVGRKVAKQYLSPLRSEGLIEHGSVETLTVDEIITILTALVNHVGPEFKERVLAVSIGFNDPAPIVEEDDTPF